MIKYNLNTVYWLSEERNEEAFKSQYMSEFTPHINNEPIHCCGECIFFEPGRGCTTSYLEAKYGNSHTPACTEFKIKDKE